MTKFFHPRNIEQHNTSSTPAPTNIMATPTQTPRISLLLINPNTTAAMTTALEPAIASLHLDPSIKVTYFTCPSTPSVPGIPSINSPADASASAVAALPHIIPLIPEHDAFLVACYSAHPLVQQIAAECEKLETPSNESPRRRRYVTGIFESSVTASLNIIGAAGPGCAFGIVSTGKIWETALADAVHVFLGGDTPRFAGCETTGLNAVELHEMPAAEVRKRMMDATARLVKKATEKGARVRAVCLGCAGMVGLEEAVRTALMESLGAEEGGRVAVVDGVRAGVGQLVELCKGGF